MRRSAIIPDDRKLIQIVDAAFADAARRSGEWLVCRPGCTQCCVGVFAINQLDALRLQEGLRNLENEDRERAERIKKRARNSIARLSKDFPGDPVTGTLDESDEAKQRFAEFANDEACPVLDPLTGTCDLYEARPMTCRVFGPPLPSEEGLGACELCYHGATDVEIIACEIRSDPDDLESPLVKELERTTGKKGHTIVACALAPGPG
jgi:Fe-S-cluster containining protein